MNDPSSYSAPTFLTLSTDSVARQSLIRLLGEAVAARMAPVPFQGFVSGRALHRLRADVARIRNRLLRRCDVGQAWLVCTLAGVTPAQCPPVCVLRRRFRHRTLFRTAIASVTTALRSLNSRRVFVVAPYTPRLSHLLVHYLEMRGFRVTRCVSLGLGSESSIQRIDSDEIVRLCTESVPPRTEAVFLSCTALDCLGVVEQIERNLGIPVVTSVQAVAWESSWLCGVPLRLRPGELFDMPYPVYPESHLESERVARRVSAALRLSDMNPCNDS